MERGQAAGSTATDHGSRRTWPYHMEQLGPARTGLRTKDNKGIGFYIWLAEGLESLLSATCMPSMKPPMMRAHVLPLPTLALALLQLILIVQGGASSHANDGGRHPRHLSSVRPGVMAARLTRSGGGLSSRPTTAPAAGRTLLRAQGPPTSTPPPGLTYEAQRLPSSGWGLGTYTLSVVINSFAVTALLDTGSGVTLLPCTGEGGTEGRHPM